MNELERKFVSALNLIFRNEKFSISELLIKIDNKRSSLKVVKNIAESDERTPGHRRVTGITLAAYIPEAFLDIEGLVGFLLDKLESLSDSSTFMEESCDCKYYTESDIRRILGRNKKKMITREQDVIGQSTLQQLIAMS